MLNTSDLKMFAQIENDRRAFYSYFEFDTIPSSNGMSCACVKSFFPIWYDPLTALVSWCVETTQSQNRRKIFYTFPISSSTFNMVSLKIASILLLLSTQSDAKEKQPSKSKIRSSTDKNWRKLIWMPDCSKPAKKDLPQCLCRYPTNFETDICQEWFAKPNIQEALNIDTGGVETRIINGVPVPTGSYPWFAKAIDGDRWGGCGGMLVGEWSKV